MTKHINGLFDALNPTGAQREAIFNKVVSAGREAVFGGSADDARVAPRQRGRWLRPVFVGTACGLAVVMFGFLVFPKLLYSPIGGERYDPIHLSSAPATSPAPGTSHPGASPAPGAIRHDIDPAQIIGQGTPAGVPFGYFFTNRLELFANNETGINMNNGVRWEDRSFGIEEVQAGLQTTVNSPRLPNGDYTMKQKVMIDEATGRTIAYQTVYIYFTPENMFFRHGFSVFHFALDDFTRRDSARLDQSENIIEQDGRITIESFPTPVVNTSFRFPHKRELVYFNNGDAIVVEAITAAAATDDDTVDEPRSLARYEESDQQLIDIMTSLL